MEKEIKTRSFVKWELDELEDTFGLKQVRTWPEYPKYPSERPEIPAITVGLLEALRLEWAVWVDNWNEVEHQLNLTGPLLRLVNFTTEHFRNFAQREISAEVPLCLFDESASNPEIEKIVLKGAPDWFVAAGRHSPKAPYFCIHEYKRGIDGSGDPRPQLLAALLVGQTLNPDPTEPMYGAYTIGRLWFFVVLQKREYAVSPAYDATKTDELQELFGALLALKAILLRRFE